MSEQERLFAQYEDAFFALLMNEVAEAEGQELLKKNEQLLADPNAAVPDIVSKRCLRTIEKSCRKARFQRTTRTVLRNLNRVALWILVPLFLFAGAFAASETIRVKTLNYLVEEFDVELRFTSKTLPTPIRRKKFLPQILLRSFRNVYLMDTRLSLKTRMKYHAICITRIILVRKL